MTPAEGHEGGLSVRDQIERYRTAFIAVVTMIVIAAGVGGYILAHENLKLPSWVPVLGHTYFNLDSTPNSRPHRRSPPARARRSRSPARRSGKSRPSTYATAWRS
jgi:hypothetical protein